jgi:ABC-type branched-subunit amino acid transport system substrate-binding protein
MARRIRVTIILALSLIPVISFSQEKQTVKIGFSSPLSGPQAAAGKDNQGGFQMAIERLNSEGLTIDGKKVRFEPVMEDDQADPRAGVSVAQKLVDTGVKAVVGP